MFLRNDLSLSGDATAKEDGVKDTLIVSKTKAGNGEIAAEIAFPQTLRGGTIDETETPVILEALKAVNSFDTVIGPNTKNPTWTDIAAPMQYYDSNDPVNPGFKLVGVAFITFDAQVVADQATNAGLLYGVALVILVLASSGGALLVIRATEPGIARLQEDTELVIRGDLKQVRSMIRMKELEALAHSINRLIQKAPQATGGGRSVAEDMAAGRAPSAALALPAQAGPVDNAGATATVRAVVSAIEDAVIVVDSESNVVEVNKPAERLFGLIPSRVRGKHLLEAITDQDLLNTVLDVINEVTAAPDGVVAREATLPGGKPGRISAAGVRQGNELAGAAIVFMMSKGDE
jgi:PAS domain S-box-containing protein